MKYLSACGAALILLGMGMVGCNKQDTGGTGNTPPSVPQAGGMAANSGAGAPATTADFSSDEKITETVAPGVKKALANETALQGADNSIEVEVKDKKIFLKGNVTNNDAKRKAGEVAETALKGMNPPAEVTVNNSLMVKNR